MSGTLLFGDEFNTFDAYSKTDAWRTAYHWGSSTVINGEKAYYVDTENAGTTGPAGAVNPFGVSGGVLTITTAPATAALPTGQPYTSGVLSSMGRFERQYGYYEIRADLPGGQGFWPAFWLMPADKVSPPELDIMEFSSKRPNEYVTTAHSKAGGTYTMSQKFTKDLPNLAEGFHTYAVDWQADTTTWYFDDRKVYSIATPADFHKPMYMLVNQAAGGGSWIGPPDGSTQSFDIDYVRVYDTKPGSAPTPVVTPTPPPVTPNRSPGLQGDRYLELQESNPAVALSIARPVDPDGDPLGVTITSLPAGTLRLADGRPVDAGTPLSADDLSGLTYAPAPGLSGSAGSFSYAVSDGRGGSAGQSIAIQLQSLTSQLAGFDPLGYLADNPDVSAAVGVDPAAAQRHFTAYGRFEGRSTSFDPLAYTASHPDLIAAFGTDRAAAAQHYIDHGRSEGRGTSFDPYNYLAAHTDLQDAFGADAQAGERHYIDHGWREGRAAHGFDTLRYVAGNPDLIDAFGTDARAAEVHYITHGRGEGRATAGFDPAAYVGAYPDLQAAFGTDTEAAMRHYIQHGKAEGRTAGMAGVGESLLQTGSRSLSDLVLGSAGGF